MSNINDEQVVRTYFGKVVGAQRRAKIDMLDQDIGFRIQRQKDRKHEQWEERNKQKHDAE